MFAGGSVEFLRPLIVGQRVHREDTVLSVTPKSGARGGDFVVVAVQTRLFDSSARWLCRRFRTSSIATSQGFFTDTSICIGCKACEVACKEWNRNPRDGDLELLGSSYDNTGALGASTWRHVAFIEQKSERIEEARATGRALIDLGMPGMGPPAPADPAPAETMPPDTPEFRWLISSDVCKHCTYAGCLDVCPTGALFRTEFGTVVVQADVCNGCGTCVAGCPFGVVERRTDGTAAPKTRRGERKGEQPGVPEVGIAHKCTLCYDRLIDDQTPACAKTCPTTSIKFGDHADMVAQAKQRVAELHAQGRTEARLYGANELDGVGGTGSVFLLLDEPEVYGLPPDPRVPTADLPRMFKRAGLAAAGMAAAAVLSFIGGRS
jgi:formate dehydrogenase iron-sulfur subunit